MAKTIKPSEIRLCPQAKPRHGGFSFVEIVVVITMLFLLTSIIYTLVGGAHPEIPAKVEEVKIWEEVRDDEYEQEFESFSQ